MTQLQTVADRYHLIDTLGTGGMGTVYRAKDSDTGELVAVKWLRQDLVTAQGDMLERFRREGEALRALNHPNIVKMLDTVEAKGQHYLVMEYMPGGDLYQLIKHEPLPARRVMELGLDIADALTRAHRLDIIHRDLKPANVLLADDGTPRLTDFGVAHIGSSERVTETGVAVGTVDYLAPESLNGEEIDARADIWSFGVMLYEMLAGERPFTGGTMTQVLVAIMTASVPDLEKVRPDAPVALVDLIYRMLQRDVHQRITSVRQIGVELEALLHGTPAPHKPAPTGRFATPTPDVMARKNNLPAQSTPFVGREAELRELSRLVQSPKTRFVTVVAPGGMGKSRLALEVGQAQLSNFKNGVYFVELAPLDSADNIPKAIAEATGFQFPQNTTDQMKELLTFIGDKQLLLIMDNYEHLLDGANIVSDILANAPNVQVLVTTREKLNLNNENLFRIEGMDFPEWETPEDALEYSAVKLFMQSARRVRPDYELQADDLQYVARICRLVQGLPLGILLAASWLEMLSPREIAEEITGNVDFLETEERNVPQRHRSIRAVFDYSWDLMTETEQDAYMRLAVFRGGFTRMAAQGIADASLRTLMGLMNKSLIQRNADNGRYSIHELSRQYAEEKLNHYGGADIIREEHGKYYLQAVASREPSLRGGGQRQSIEDIELDFENVRAAWWWALKNNQHELVADALFPLFIYSNLRSRWVEVSTLLENTRSYLAEQGQENTVLYARAISYYPFAFDDALERLEHSIPILEREGAARDIIQAYITNALLHIGQNNDYETADGFALKAVELAEQADDKFLLRRAFHLAGFCKLGIPDYAAATDYTNRAVEVGRAGQDKSGMAASLHNVGAYYNYFGKWQEAITAWEEANAIQREIGNRFGAMFTRCGITLTELMRGKDLTELEAAADSMMQEAQDINAPQGIALTHTIYGWIAHQREQYDKSIEHFEQALTFDRNPSILYNINNGLAMGYVAQKKFDEAKTHARDAMTFGRDIGAAASFSWCVLAPAAILAHEGAHERAAELLGWAYNHEFAPQAWYDKTPIFQSLQDTLIRELGEAKFDDAYEHGKALEDWRQLNIDLINEFTLPEA